MIKDARTDSGQPTKGCGAFGRFLLLWYLIAIFTVFSVSFEDQRLSCFVAFPVALVMFVRNISDVDQREISLLSGLLIIALISVLAGANADFLAERAGSFLLFAYSMFMAYSLRLELGRATRKDISWTSGALLIGIMLATVLEFLGPIKPISDAFRVWNAPFAYFSDQRDFVIAGFVRPSVFTQEPSYAAIGVAVFSFVWFISAQSRYRALIFGFVTVLAAYLYRSPISIIPLIPAGLVLLSSSFSRDLGRQHPWRAYFSVLAVTSSLLAAYISISSISEARRLSSGRVTGDQSLIIRLIAPPRIAALVMEESPAMGAGLGGRSALLDQVQTVFGELGIRNEYLSAAEVDSIPNAFWEHWIYFGLLGGLIAGYLIVRYYRILYGHISGMRCVPSLLFLILLANSFGAYATPRIWSYATLVVIATARSCPNRPSCSTTKELAESKTRA